jgi:hypothetical protein
MSDLNKSYDNRQFQISNCSSKSRTNKKNQSPLYCRLINGIRKQLSTGIHIEGEYWDSKNQVILKTHKSAIFTIPNLTQ